MGLWKLIFGGGASGVADAVTDVAEVFKPNATRDMELRHEARSASLEQFGFEFQNGSSFWFDRLINGMNRLPRPMLALGTIGLFVYAMVDPIGFGGRMRGLDHVPEPLWWLLGAIVSFYFGAREMHYIRKARPKPAPRPQANSPQRPAPQSPDVGEIEAAKPNVATGPEVDIEGLEFTRNDAVNDWLREQKDEAA